VNKVILIGNLGADPESRTTGSGMTVTNLRLATSEQKKDADGNWEEHTEWHRVVTFGKTAENCAQYLVKGRKIGVEGNIRTNEWKDKEGNRRWTTEIIANNIEFLSPKSESTPEAVPAGNTADDDIPF
jgi:single-strand DNA-binding protein